jgi:hypothetical protein
VILGSISAWARPAPPHSMISEVEASDSGARTYCCNYGFLECEYFSAFRSKVCQRVRGRLNPRPANAANPISPLLVTCRNLLLRTHPRHSASRERALYFAGPRCCVQAPSGAFSRASGSCAPANHRRSKRGFFGPPCQRRAHNAERNAISTVVVHLCGRYAVIHSMGAGDPPACNAGPSRVLINRSCASRESQTSNTRKPALAEPAAARTVLGRAAGSARRDRRAWAALKHPVQPWS